MGILRDQTQPFLRNRKTEQKSSVERDAPTSVCSWRAPETERCSIVSHSRTSAETTARPATASRSVDRAMACAEVDGADRASVLVAVVDDDDDDEDVVVLAGAEARSGSPTPSWSLVVAIGRRVANASSSDALVR